jgi:hypothetical protein
MWQNGVMNDAENGTEKEDEPAKEEARIRLKQATSAFTRGEEQQRRRREALAEAIADAFRAGLRPREIEAIAPYDRNHIGRIRRDAGIPARRPPTVISAREARERQDDPG